jgi:type I restriction enzyme S subunit
LAGEGFLKERLFEFVEVGQFLGVDGFKSLGFATKSSLAQLDQSILSKAFRGELVPQDSGDEPASELLKRIRTTGEKLEAEKKAAKKKTKKKTAKRKATSDG